MRVLVNDYSGHPFQAQLSRELAARGHTVLHTYCGSYATGRGALTVMPGDPASLAFKALDLGAPFAKHSIVRRLVQERRFGQLLVDAARHFEPDVIISANTPLFAQQQAMGWARGQRVRFVYWLQDVTSTAMGGELRRRFGALGLAPARYLARLERRLLRASDAVVPITSDFAELLKTWHVPSQRVTLIENWAPLAEMPLRPRHNQWSAAHGLDGKFVFLYAGTLGLKHDPELLVQLAMSTKRSDVARVVVVSEGGGADLCQGRAREEGLTNLIVLPFQPYPSLPDVLATGDVLLTILKASAGTFSVPSKTLSYHCAGRPILASVPSANLAARVIDRAQSGALVEPGDSAAFCAAAARLLNDASLRQTLGSNARAYAERTFDIASIATRFESLLSAPSTDHIGAASRNGPLNAH